MPDFIQHRLYARDPAKARAFYRDLLGWTINDEGSCSFQGREVATIIPSKAPPHVPSYWLPFLGVDPLDLLTEKARALGAQIRQHSPGQESVIVDPRGASFGLCHQGKNPGTMAWNELLTDDPAAAASFYTALLGFEVTTVPLNQSDLYRILQRHGTQVAGVMRHPANLHPHWQSYLSVDDVDAVTERALELGATLYFAPKDQPHFGRWSAIDDPVGAGVCFLRRF